MSKFVVGAALVAAVAVVAAAIPAKEYNIREGEALIVNTSQGTLLGRRYNDVDHFLGIPFGLPPVGERRFRRPEPAAAWEGVRSAEEFGPNCMTKISSDYVKGNISEDCLYLNVYRPVNATGDAKLPVMIWLFGGSWEWGGSSFFLYQGRGIVNYGNVVLVTINYRLAMFGFVAHPSLQAEDEHNSTGNYGVQDQRLAFEWVQQNIAAFGGDPDNVMLFGQSAGAGSVSFHTVAPASNGLFHKATMESGPPSDWVSRNLSDVIAHTNRIADAVNCSGLEGESWTSCMRNVPADVLTLHPENTPNLSLNWFPVVDGVELTDFVPNLWKRNMTNDVSAMLFGVVQDEGTEFMEFIKPDDTCDDYVTWLKTRWGGSLLDDVNKTYPCDLDTTPFFTAARAYGDALMGCPARRTATWASSRGIPVYLYHFTHQPFLFKVAEPQYRVGHSSDVPFVWHDSEVLLGEGEVALADQVVSYWTNFAATSNPNKVGSNNPNGIVPAVEWVPFSPSGNHNFLNLNLTTAMETDFIGSVYCDMWDQYFFSGCYVNGSKTSC
ncbi:uncharacterized protein MONBRDRAFT_38638 [Monosiga brevicollis MX1]|uniref:Carboxylic ester hydrolase n=1 Tax=Monosiga brevicollis TaxID=81824 RepID=A9V9I9_MONBE|nr:uncharacterized protein MONBRDRAFT_38638 [Monosiga brevicollis MX1]EDQ85871.1 predicted protein [Monosiga brevicollis MX1]|eukprot:XP_001749350.1 hypothetical protein [Monosiga brevicollis MX1]